MSLALNFVYWILMLSMAVIAIVRKDFGLWTWLLLAALAVVGFAVFGSAAHAFRS